MTENAENKNAASGRRWSFGSAMLDERSFRLYVNGKPVELERKPLEVLLHLLRHAGELVTKDDLLAAVWPGRILTETVLTKCVHKLREVLDDNDQCLIATVHGQGYRLEAAVRSVAADAQLSSEEGESSSQPSRRLAAVMFTDLVGYSALAHKDEALAIELLELHRTWVREILPKHGGKEIETIGDAFLVVFSGALAAVECAAAIQQRFGDYNRSAPEPRRMQLRIGIHLGDVEHRGKNVMGDGVNIASRIHGMAEPGGICVSEAVHHVVRNRTGLRFVSIGRPALKNIATSLELFRVASGSDMAGTAPRLPQLPRLSRRALAGIVAAAVAIAGAGLAFWVPVTKEPTATPSVAVLPFENLSAEADSAYFTDGLHDIVIGHLARIQGLKVISRTSVMRYREHTTNLREIGRELGVAHIVEGSVQRAGGRLRVAAQLIDTETDTHLWSSEYDRDLADVFAVQADIARQVASAVHAQLTPRAAAAIARVPTESAEAYDLYLRALAKIEVTPEGTQQAIGWLERALELDPLFALAWAELSSQHDTMYWWGYDPVPARAAQALRAAERALQLGPDQVEAHVSLAWALYHGKRDYDGALRELERARELEPGHHDLYLVLGSIYRRQGRWDDALAAFRRAVELDPLNGANLGELVATYEMLGRYLEANALYGRMEALGADSHRVAWLRAFNLFQRTGQMDEMQRVAAAVPPDYDPACGPSHGRWILAMLQRRFADAAAVIQRCEYGHIPLDAEAVPTDVYAAIAYGHAGDAARARQFAARARAKLAQALEQDADLPQARMALARMLLLLGDRTAALREADRALEQMPMSRDALVGAALLGAAIGLHAQAGEIERAFDELARGFALPIWLSIHEIRLEPDFDPLRGDPRFQKLIAEHLPKE